MSERTTEMTQLREDIVRTFRSARELVVSHPPGQDGLADALMRRLEGATRFVDPHPEITAARRTVHEGAEEVIEVERRIRTGRNRVARTQLVTALAELEAALYAYGRVNVDADKVGLGVLGSPL